MSQSNELNELNARRAKQEALTNCYAAMYSDAVPVYEAALSRLDATDCTDTDIIAFFETIMSCGMDRLPCTDLHVLQGKLYSDYIIFRMGRLITETPMQ